MEEQLEFLIKELEKEKDLYYYWSKAYYKQQKFSDSYISNAQAKVVENVISKLKEITNGKKEDSSVH